VSVLDVIQPPTTEANRWPWERIESRTLVFALVLAIHLLLALMFLTLAPKLSHKPVDTAIVELRNYSEQKTEATTASQSKAAVKQPKPVPPRPQMHPPMPPQPLTFGPQVDPSFDISKLPNQHTAVAQADTAGDSPVAYGPGQGPGGSPIYNAEWYREPTRAELAPYLPPAIPAPGSWATIACHAAPKYHVEDCEIVDEWPRGSGLARGIQAAAWQFLVIPERKGGKPLIGGLILITEHWDFADKDPN
jgi:hypothetical protein